jgi:hypothetical protein
MTLKSQTEYSDRDIYQFIGLVLRDCLDDLGDHIVCISEPWANGIGLRVQAYKSGKPIDGVVFETDTHRKMFIEIMDLFERLTKEIRKMHINFVQISMIVDRQGKFIVDFFNLPRIEFEDFGRRADKIMADLEKNVRSIGEVSY